MERAGRTRPGVVPNPQASAPSPPQPPKPLVLRPIRLQTVAVGQPLVVPLSVEDAAYWQGKVRFSLGGDPPPGASLDQATGLFTWTPPEDCDPGTKYCSVWANGPDGQWSYRLMGLTVTPAERPLRLEPIGPKTVRAGGPPLSFSAAIEDAAYWRGRGRVKFACDPVGRWNPRWRAPELKPATGWFTWSPSTFQPPGEYSFTMSVTGPTSQPDRERFTVRVLPPLAPRRPSR